MPALLHPLVFEPLPLGAVKPRGWLRRQLRIQADGLSGHLDEFWPDIQHSRWFGGTAEGWERAPYWLDGFVPLAFLLEDEALIGRARQHMDTILSSQQPGGWLGPVETNPQTGEASAPKGYDAWAELLIFKVLVEYHRATGEARILDALEKGLGFFDRYLDHNPLFNWGQFRWFEGLIAIYYLYEHRPQDWLLDLAVKIQAQGFDWGTFFRRWPYQDRVQQGRWSFMSHVVNNAMAVKAGALWSRVSGEDADRESSVEMIRQLDHYHGMVTGMFSGDECLAGKNPTQGTELCAVNEYAYSLEWLAALLGDASIGDRLEQIVYNALPATFSPDMWTHQYDQQVNQAACTIDPQRPWTTNGPESNLFGLEPNFGCCTANLSQGWPKFAAHLWMRSAAGGLAAVAYAPCQVVAEIAGRSVTIDVETDYPFRDDVTLRLTVSGAARFPLHLRIPAWAQQPEVWVGEEQVECLPGNYLVIVRDWAGEICIRLRFPSRPRLAPGFAGAVALARGPLVYGLTIAEEWRRVHLDQPYREPPHADYEVLPLSPWNYGLALDPDRLESCVTFDHRELGEFPFSPAGAAVSAHVKGRRLPDWEMHNGSAGTPPASPVHSDQPLEDLELIPYGCTTLRITEFPLLQG